MIAHEFYYVQNRGVCSNSIMWWALNDRGYTCDVRCAKIWTKAEVQAKQWRSFDMPWPKTVIDRLVQYHVDIQDLAKDNDGNFQKYPHTLIQWRPDLCGDQPSAGTANTREE